eukprot:754272-Hanusia_phi.AAC.2
MRGMSWREGNGWSSERRGEVWRGRRRRRRAGVVLVREEIDHDPGRWRRMQLPGQGCEVHVAGEREGA